MKENKELSGKAKKREDNKYEKPKFKKIEWQGLDKEIGIAGASGGCSCGCCGCAGGP